MNWSHLKYYHARLPTGPDSYHPRPATHATCEPLALPVESGEGGFLSACKASPKHALIDRIGLLSDARMSILIKGCTADPRAVPLGRF